MARANRSSADKRSDFIIEVQVHVELSKEDINQLLKAIFAHKSLQGLFLVLNNLNNIFSHLENLCRLTGQEALYNNLFKPALRTSQIILEKEEQLKRFRLLRKLFEQPGKTTEEHFHGILEKAPAYCCLGYQAILVDEYNHLLAQTLLAAHKIEDSNPNEEQLKRLLIRYRAVRDLSESAKVDELSNIPKETTTPESLFKITHSAPAKAPLHLAGLILKDAYKGFTKSHKAAATTSKPRTKKRQLKTEDDLEDFEDSTKRLVGDDYPSKEQLTREELNTYLTQSGSAGEFKGTQDNIPVAEVKGDQYSGPTLRDLAFQAKLKSNQIALANQLSPISWNELNQYDLFILFQFLTGQINPDNSEEIDAVQVRAILTLLFFSSTSIERILSFGFSQKTPEEESPEGLFWCDGKSPIIRLHSPGPPLIEAHKSKTSKLAHKVTYFSHIPLPEIAVGIVKEYLLRNNALSESKEFLFGDGQLSQGLIEIINRQTKNTLNSLKSKQTATRLSIGRISHYLLNAIANQQGVDLPSSQLFFGYQDEHAPAKLFYTLAPIQRVECNYRSFISNTLADIGLPANFPSNHLANKNNYLGTPFCPQADSVQALVKRLLANIEDTRPVTNSLAGIVNNHNNYAIYTACFIAFATGYRAIKDPSFKYDEIDYETGLAVISDKDDKWFYHSRLVWIADICLRQIELYRKHLLNLYDFLSYESPAIFELVRNHSGIGSPLNLFFLHSDLSKAEVLAPGVLGNLLKENFNYDIPVNAHRHYMKTELLSSGCSPEIIETQLGHWSNGQEPWTRFSHLHPLIFREEISRHLLPILIRGGWIPVKGFEP
jgi:hypothetical protein